MGAGWAERAAVEKGFRVRVLGFGFWVLDSTSQQKTAN